MTVQNTANTALSLYDPLIFRGIGQDDELYTDQIQYFGDDPLGYYAMTQRRLTNYIEMHPEEAKHQNFTPPVGVKWSPTKNWQPNVVCISMVGVATGSFRLPEIESSTLQAKIDEELKTTLKRTLQRLEENITINSDDSEIFYELNTFFIKYKEDALRCLLDLITGNKIHPIFAGRLLRHLGYKAKDFPTNSISWLLENFLISKKIPIRNGAILGLAYLNNPETIPAIQKALEAEHIPEIKSNIQQTLEQLINTSKCQNTYEE